MLRKTVRIRGRNQLTLPGEIGARLNVSEGDFLDLVLTDDGTVQLLPARLARIGTPEAEQEILIGRADIRAGRSKVFKNERALRDALYSARPNAVEAEGESPKRADSVAALKQSVDRALAVQRAQIRSRVAAPRGVHFNISSLPAEEIATVNIRGHETNVTVTRRGEPLYIGTIPVGAEDYKQAVKMDLGLLSPEGVDPAGAIYAPRKQVAGLRELMSRVSEGIRQACVREVDKVYVAGDVQQTPGLVDFLRVDLAVPVSEFPAAEAETRETTAEESVAAVEAAVEPQEAAAADPGLMLDNLSDKV